MSSTSIKTAVAAFYKKEVEKKKSRVVAIVKNGALGKTTRNLPSVAEREKDHSAYSFRVHENLLGSLRLDGNVVEGWVAEKTAKRYSGALLLKLAGDPGIHLVREVERPESPYSIQPPGNAKFFRSDISKHTRNKRSEDYLGISLHVNRGDEAQPEVGPILMFLSVAREENEPLNQNPEFNRQSTGSIENWTIKCDDSLGLRVDEFRQSKSFDTFAHFDPDIFIDRAGKTEKGKTKGKDKFVPGSVRPTRYTRIALTEGHSTESTCTLTTDLLVDPSLEEKELELAILLRADRTTNINARLLRDGKVLSCVGFSAETHWTEVRRQFSNTLTHPRHKTAEYKLEIDVVHRGRGYVDLVACSVSTSPSIQTVLRPGYLSQKKKQNKRKENFVRNGDFSRWTKGFNFEKLQPRQETADAWRIDCKPEESHAAQVSLVQLGGQLDGIMNHGLSKFGLNVRTQSFNGSMRLISVLGREFQNCQSVVLKLNIQVPGQSEPTQALRKICLMGKRVGGEEILHVFTRKPVVESSNTFEYTLTENELVNIRNLSSKHSNIQLCFDLEENSNIVVSSIEMYDNANKEETIDSPQNVSDAKTEISFEDPAITEQATFLKGLEGWAAGKHPEKFASQQGNTKYISKASSIELARPKLVRPAKNFPTLDIIVPVHNALDAVKQCMLSIIEETAVPYTLHCIDDASNAETNAWLTAFCDDFQHVQLHINSENIGYTRSVNRGLNESNADWVCVLNSDAIVTNGWLEKLVNVTNADSSIGIVSPLSNAASYQSVPRIYEKDDKANGWSFNPLPAGVSPNDMAAAVKKNSLSVYPEVGVSNGFCQLISRKMLDKIGILDEESFPRGFGEENDLCARAIQAGWQIRIADDTYVFHIKSQSFGHEQRVDLSKHGKEALKRKHPDVNWNEITNKFQNLSSLVELRQRLVKQGF